ncbi:NADPH-dependent F420 reductase [Streptomyces sp. NPDC046821]|uniref:NADPH-dependent F420 reductase n=1 Tax=Streptomyces sp. NPDC046821 TaxID=3154702 RepID=UPI0033E7289E
MSTVAVVGGTGPQGKGLAYRFARGGHDVILGSRDGGRAAQAADELAARLGGRGGTVTGAVNAEATTKAQVALLAVPFTGHDVLVASLAAELADKVVISCVNPIGFDRHGPHGLELGGTSAAETAQALLPDSAVVGAFHHLSAVSLNGDADLLDHEDVLVCGDDQEAKQTVMELAATITGKPGIDAGALRLARQLEPLTAVLISINKRYKVRSGLAIHGVSGS